MHSTPEKHKHLSAAEIKRLAEKELTDRRMDAIQENAAMRQSTIFKERTKLMSDPKKPLQKARARAELNY
jgi:hypothetical protein